MRWVMGLAVFGCVLVFSGIAHAATPTESAKPTKWGRPASSVTAEEPEYDDYRLSLLGSDAAALSLVVVGALVSEDNETLGNIGLVGGVATYALGGPILHLTHEQPGRAMGSFALRVGLPGVGILLFAGMAASCDEGDAEGYCVLAAAVFGGMIMIGGVVTAMIVDDGFLGRVPKAQPKKDTGASSFQAGLAPFIDPKKRSVGLSLVGAF